MKRIFVTLSVFLLISCSNQSDNELNIYTSRQPQLLEPIIEDFYADTGIKVNLLSGNAQELMERIDIEGENTKADIFMTVDAGVLWQANERGIFSEIESDILSNNIPTYLKDPNNSWFGFSKRAKSCGNNSLYRYDHAHAKSVRFNGKGHQRTHSGFYPSESFFSQSEEFQ